MLAGEGTNSGNIDTQMGWNPRGNQRAYMQDPEVSLNKQTMLAGLA